MNDNTADSLRFFGESCTLVGLMNEFSSFFDLTPCSIESALTNVGPQGSADNLIKHKILLQGS